MTGLRVRRAAGALALLVLLAGCAGRHGLPARPSPARLPPGSPLANRTLADPDAWARHYLMGAYPDSALTVLDRVGGDALLRTLQRASVLRHVGRWAESNAEFERAEREIDLRYTRSLRRAAGSLLLNDGVLAYVPGRSERAMIPVYRMLNYLALGDTEGAAVEARKAGAAGERTGERCADGPVSEYLAGMVFAAAGERNDALVALRHAAAESTACGGGAPAEALVRDLVRSAERAGLLEAADSLRVRYGLVPLPASPEMGELVLVVEDGWVAHRESEDVLIPVPGADTDSLDPGDDEEVARIAARISARLLSPDRRAWADDGTDGYLLRLAWPTIRRPRSGVAIRIWVDDTAVPAAAAEDLSAGVARDLDAARAAIAARTVARGLAKYLITREVERKAEKQGGEWLGSLLGAVANTAGNLTERADTRSWTLLPGHVWMARLSLPPGEHRVRLELRDANGARSVDLGTVRIGGGEVAFASRRLWGSPGVWMPKAEGVASLSGDRSR